MPRKPGIAWSVPRSESYNFSAFHDDTAPHAVQPAYVEEAKRAAIAYLESYFPKKLRRTKKVRA
jgi:hypothetical protein